MATKLDLVMQARKPTDIAIYGQFVIDDRGHLRVESSYINKVEVPSVIRFLTEWYSDPTPPTPDAATLRKAELFEELTTALAGCITRMGELDGGCCACHRRNADDKCRFCTALDVLAKAKAAKA